MQILLISAAVAAVVGFGLGYRVADGSCARDKLAIAESYVAHTNAALDAARIDAETEAQRRTEQALQDERRASAAREARVKGQRHEIANRRLGCDWSPERIGMLTYAITAANGAAPKDAGNGVHDQLPATANTSGSR